MAPIRRFTNRVQAAGRISMGLSTTNDDVLQPVINVRQITDPFIKFVLGEYVAMERQRAEFYEMFGQLLEGAGINLSNFQTAMEDLDMDGTVDDTVLSGDVTTNPSDTINDDVQPLAPRT